MPKEVSCAKQETPQIQVDGAEKKPALPESADTANSQTSQTNYASQTHPKVSDERNNTPPPEQISQEQESQRKRPPEQEFEYARAKRRRLYHRDPSLDESPIVAVACAKSCKTNPSILWPISVFPETRVPPTVGLDVPVTTVGEELTEISLTQLQDSRRDFVTFFRQGAIPPHFPRVSTDALTAKNQALDEQDVDERDERNRTRDDSNFSSG